MLLLRDVGYFADNVDVSELSILDIHRLIRKNPADRVFFTLGALVNNFPEIQIKIFRIHKHNYSRKLIRDE